MVSIAACCHLQRGHRGCRDCCGPLFLFHVYITCGLLYENALESAPCLLAQPFKRMSAEGPGQPHKRPALADLTANQRRFSGGVAAAPGAQSAPRIPLSEQRTSFAGFGGAGGSPQPMVVSPPQSPKQPPQQVRSSAGTSACQARMHGERGRSSDGYVTPLPAHQHIQPPLETSPSPVQRPLQREGVYRTSYIPVHLFMLMAH